MQEEAPYATETDPAEQKRHVAWPVEAWYAPGGHGAEAAPAPGHFQPEGHVTAVEVEFCGQ